jgi:hypothetical protein
MSKHLRTRRKVNPNTFFFCFLKLKKPFVDLAQRISSVSNATKIVQFNRRMQNVMGCWCKGVQCSMIGELKTN